MKRHLKYILFCLKWCNWTLRIRIRFWLIVSKWGPHLAQSFIICNSSCKILLSIISLEMHMASAISRNFICWSFYTIPWTCWMIFGFVIVFWRPSRGLFLRPVRPDWKRAALFFTVESEYTAYLYTFNNFGWISSVLKYPKQRIQSLYDIKFKRKSMIRQY